MQRLTIPTVENGAAEELGLKKWVAGRRWPREYYFKLVNRCRSVLGGLSEDLSDRPESIVYLVAGALHDDAGLQHYIRRKRRVAMGDQDEWARKCLLAAWVIVQAYAREVSKEAWDTDL